MWEAVLAAKLYFITLPAHAIERRTEQWPPPFVSELHPAHTYDIEGSGAVQVLKASLAAQEIRLPLTTTGATLNNVQSSPLNPLGNHWYFIGDSPLNANKFLQTERETVPALHYNM